MMVLLRMRNALSFAVVNQVILFFSKIHWGIIQGVSAQEKLNKFTSAFKKTTEDETSNKKNENHNNLYMSIWL